MVSSLFFAVVVAAIAAASLLATEIDSFSVLFPSNSRQQRGGATSHAVAGSLFSTATPLSSSTEASSSTSQTESAIGSTASSSTTTTITTVSSSTASETPYSFIQTELRGAAMKLHTKRQAPREGQAVSDEIRVPYVPTHADYLQYLVDSLCVYQALEDIVQSHDDLAVFRDTGLERTIPLQIDIEYLVDTYDLSRSDVGRAGRDYAQSLRTIFGRDCKNDRHKNIPEFVCHYYNFYFAHTAGGRMIGKQMSALLLDKKTLAFYQVKTSSVSLSCVVVAHSVWGSIVRMERARWRNISWPLSILASCVFCSTLFILSLRELVFCLCALFGTPHSFAPKPRIHMALSHSGTAI
jgi:hypothetical protein